MSDSPVPPSSPPPASSAGAGLVFILGALTVIGPFAVDMYLPALPEIGRELGVGTGMAQLTLSVFLLGIAVGQAFMGPIVDRWGRRGPLLVGLAVYVVAGVGCARAESMPALLAWRLIMALGSASSMVVPRAIVRDLFNELESAKMYSLLMLILGVSPILAPSAGGLIMTLTGWRGIFWVLSGLGVACVAAVIWYLPDTAPAGPATRRGGIRQALKTYGRLLRDPRFYGGALVTGFTIGAIFSYLNGSSFVLIELYGLTPQQYGAAFGCNGVGLILASQINRGLISRYPVRRVLGTASFGGVLVGLGLLVVGATGWGGLPGLMALLFLNLATAGFIAPNITAIVMAPFGEVAGSTSALLGTVQFGIGASTGALVGILHNGTAMPMVAGVAGCAIASWIVCRTLVPR